MHARRVLLTGATGFIGRHCIQGLLARGYEVFATARRPDDILMPEVSWIGMDILNTTVVRRHLNAIRPSHLLHLAWYAVPGKFWSSSENLRWASASIELFRNFAECGGQRAVAAGTCAEYDWSSGFCDETTTPLRPATLYGACKLATQAILFSYSRQAGFSSAWGRVFSLYGPHEHPVRLVSSIIKNLLNDNPAETSAGSQVRDYLHVQDVAEAFLYLLDSGINGPVNIASGQGIALREIIKRIGEKTGRPDLLRLGAKPTLSDEPASLIGNNSCLRATGWHAEYEIDSGLAQTIAWWREYLQAINVSR